jgi:hypothetical protein
MIRLRFTAAAALMGAFSLSLGSIASGQGLTFERWNTVTSPSILLLQRDAVNVRVPNSTQVVASAEIPSNVADSYGGRLRGWVTAPQTGDYTFFVAGDDSAELWLSSDNSRFNRKLIAFNRNPTTARQWNKFASQRSQVVRLVQGQSYYLEAWMKENTSNENLAVGWHRVDIPTYAASNFGSATGTWTAGTSGGYSFSVASGGLGGTSDSASRTSRAWTGDGEFVVNLEQLAGATGTAQAGLMLRIDPAANGRHVFIGRNVAGQSSYVRRTTLGGSTSTTLGSLSGNFLRLVRSGNIISASVSADGVQWVSAGTSITFTSLPTTLEVSLVAAAVTANTATPVTGAFGLLVARPLVATEVIPGANLTPNSADPADTGDKGIPDAWQVLNGLVPSQRFGANGPYGDPDNDNLPNWQEYAFGFNPYEADSINGLITRELWTNIPGINQVVDLTNHNRFFETPDAIDLVSGVDFYFASELTNSFGARYRGQITAPKTGYYRFWVTAPDDAQLWLADGSIKRPGESQGLTSRFGKRKVASVWGAGYFASRAARYDFDSFACQRSERIWLTQGQKYYFEVLHKTRSHEMNHVSVAWQPPGEARQLVPPANLAHHLPSAADLDDDYLPDAWETTVGLSPTLNGRTDRKQGQDGDWDGDLLSNLREYQLGTNPKAADTDGDGVSDFDEVETYKSDPRVSNLLTNAVHAALNVKQFATATGAWSEGADGSISAIDQRGGIDYTFTVGSGQEGIFEVAVTGSAIGVIRSVESLPIRISLDGVLIGSRTLVSTAGGNNTVRTLTPWLKAGTYTVTVFHDNYRADRQLRIESVTINKRGGLDLNSDGYADWATAKSAAENRLTRVPTSSLVSPAAIEGVAAWELPTVVLDAAPLQAVAVKRSTENGFYANIPLNESASTSFQVNFAGGFAPEQASIQWAPTNIATLAAAGGNLNLRLGDSLRLDAWTGTSPSGTFTVTLDGSPLADSGSNTTHTSGSPLTYQFNSAGDHTLVATWNGQSYTVVVHVYAADFGAAFSVVANQARVWELPSFSHALVVEADNRIGWGEITAGTTAPRRFSVATFESGKRGVIARLPDEPDGSPGAIVASGTVTGFSIGWLDETNDAEVVHTYADGTLLMHGTLVASDLPDDIAIRLYTHFQGIQFLNGSRTLWLTKADFDVNGIAQIYFEMPAGSDPAVCNEMTLFLKDPTN